MNSIFEQYLQLEIDTSWIGLAKEENEPYFCTPVGAKIFGWDNGLHYCLIEGFDEMVFAVNPENFGGPYVYPLAKNFSDFLGLLLTAKNANALQQIIWMEKEQYLQFIQSENTIAYDNSPEVVNTLAAIQKAFAVTPILQPFEYVKALQQTFDYRQIVFSDEYYETCGLEKPTQEDKRNTSRNLKIMNNRT